MKTSWLVLLALSLPSWAQAPTGSISLEQYLNQVKAGSPQAQGLVETVRSRELAMGKADNITVTEIYGDAGVGDDQSEKLVPFMGRRTEGHGWKLGLRKKFVTGTQANLFYDSRWANITGAQGIPQPNYFENKATLELVQPLWRNGFGSETRAEIDLQLATSKIELLESKYDLKNLLLGAENTYWSLVAYNEMIKLQQENVERSRKMRDLMKNKAGLRLVDDVDFLQVQASLEMRELELQSSLDERANLIREFNTLRGVNSETVEALSDSPEKQLSVKFKGGPRISREDFDILRQKAEAARAAARGGRSHIRPQLDLVGNFSANGMDPQYGRAQSEVEKNEHENWMVGVRFSAALDFGLIWDMMNSFKAQERAAKQMGAAADFNLERTYSGLNSKHSEAQRRFEMSANLEKLQTQLVKRERQRLINGRTTTFQALTLEQNLAAAQIKKVESQLALVKIHNALKAFEEAP